LSDQASEPGAPVQQTCRKAIISDSLKQWQ
jgi:hypothetical protein